MTTDHDQKPRIPVTCTLSAAAAENQSLEWVDLWEEATSIAAIASGVRLAFPSSLLPTIEDLAARESTCCSFLTFNITTGVDGVVLEVAGEGADAQRTIRSFSGVQP